MLVDLIKADAEKGNMKEAYLDFTCIIQHKKVKT